MPTLDSVQVAALAYIAGFRGKEIAEAVAVAKGESGYRTEAANSCCVGLWQINLKAHGVTAEQMRDPRQNAAKAYAIYKAAGGWCTRGRPPNCNPWQAYGKGNWNAALSEGTSALEKLNTFQTHGRSAELIVQGIGKSGLLSNEGISPTDMITSAVSPFVEFLNRVGAWVSDSENWVRVVKVVGGMTIVIVGGVAIAKDPLMSGLRTVKKAKKLL